MHFIVFMSDPQFFQMLTSFCPPQPSPLNSTVFVTPRGSRSSRSRAEWSLSVRALCCLMTLSISSGIGSSSTWAAPAPWFVRAARSSTCWPVPCSLTATSLSFVSSPGTKKMQASHWPLANGNITGVEVHGKSGAEDQIGNVWSLQDRWRKSWDFSFTLLLDPGQTALLSLLICYISAFSISML